MAQEITKPSFEVGEALEKDIERLHKEISEKKAEMPQRDALHEAVKESIASAHTAQSPGSGTGSSQVTVSRILPSYVMQDSKEVQVAVEKLIAHAFRYGIKKAVKEAKGQGAFFLDAFHDALVDRLYDEFKRRKLFK